LLESEFPAQLKNIGKLGNMSSGFVNPFYQASFW
jgi:hypothetical protein